MQIDKLQNHNKRIIREPEVETMTGLSRSTLYAFMSEGKFPLPLKLGPRARGWKLSDILDWIETREEVRRVN